MTARARSLGWLAAALLITAITYARLMPAYFCGFDDFTNAARATLEDAGDPSRIVTTTHFGSPKYRPLSRAVTLLSQAQDWPPVLAHRLRNLVCHLLAVAMVFSLTMQLGGAPEVAFVAAALFGVHPLSHQTVAAAIFTIDLAYAAMLAALVSFLRAYDSRRHSTALIAAAMLASAIALLTYETTIVVFVCFVAYVAMRRAAGQQAAVGQRRFLTGFALGSALVLGAFFALRRLIVAAHMPLVPPQTMLLNLALFGGTLAFPVDLLLLNSLFGTPLPSEIVRNRGALLFLGGTILLPAALLVGCVSRQGRFRGVVSRIRWAPILYVTAGVPLALAPFLMFTDHPSETYLYLPVAFFAVAVSLCLHALAPRRRSFLALGSALLLLAMSGAIMRTERVRACGLVAQRILAELPLDRWRSGTWHVVLADAPGTPEMRRFGLYGYRGLGTIDPREPGVRALESALRLATHNPEMRAEAVATADLSAACADAGYCAWVDGEGGVALWSERPRR